MIKVLISLFLTQCKVGLTPIAMGVFIYEEV